MKSISVKLGVVFFICGCIIFCNLEAGGADWAPVALFPLSGDFNASGLYQLFLRELGSPGAPDFGNPAAAVSRFEPVDFKEVDALLVTGADLF